MLAISAAGRLPVEGIFHMSAGQSRDCGLLYQFMAQASGNINKKLRQLFVTVTSSL